MLFKRYTSFLISTSILIQSASPAFAMYDDSADKGKKISKKIYTKIKNISEMDETVGIVVQPGDWVILDIDKTVLKRGKGSNQDVLNLDPKVVEMVKNWQALNAAEPDPEKRITILFLTSRKPKNEAITKEQLKKAGFPENIEIIFAPNKTSFDRKIPTKGKVLIQRLETTQFKPRRMIMIDDLTENLTNVYDALQNDTVHKAIPLKLLKRKVNLKICESSDDLISFPKKLTDLSYVRAIGGGSGGVHVLKDATGQLFTFKSATNSEQMKEEILADALYRSLGVKVPAFAVYDHLPEIKEIQKVCTGPGPYRLAQFIEKDETATRDSFAEEMRKNFVADALLSNFDIVLDNFKNVELDKQGNLWRLDNGGSLRIRALGESKFGYEDWNPYEVTELETMRTKTSDGNFVYGSLSESELKEQALDILKSAPALFSTLYEMAKKLHLHNPCEVREMLRLRLDDLVKRFLLSENGQPLHLMDGFIAPQFAAGILPYHTDPNTGKKVILLGKRAGHNWWCNFGGSSDLNKGFDSDKTLAHTAVREVQEEGLGNISYTPQELEKAPSHAILNSDNVFYRMYMAQHPYVDPEQIKKAQPVPDYGWQHEYSEYRWVPLDWLLDGLKQNQLVEEESKKTIQIGDMILYPYFWEMLQEPQVKETLTNICLGKKVRAKHTHDGRAQRVIPPLSVEAEKQQLAETVVNKGFALGQIKSRDPIAYKFQTTRPAFIGPKQKNVINIFIEDGALILKQAHENPVEILHFSATASETDDFGHVAGQTCQFRKNGQKVSFLPEESYNKIIACVKNETEPSYLEKNTLLMALGLAPPADYEPEHSAEVQAMSGFLPNDEAEKLRKVLRDAPYTQTQAHLRHIMGEEVYNQLGGMSELEVDVFLEKYAKFADLHPLHKIQFHDPNKSLKDDELKILLKDNDLYLKVKNKDDLKVTVRQENELPISGLTSADYDLLKQVVSENNIELVNYNLKSALLSYADLIGYTPKLPIDPYYKQVLKKVMDVEKANRDKIMFLHGTDPLTCFLWDVFTAHRSQLKNLGANMHTTMRGLEKKFASILDVEAFIKTYGGGSNFVSNYATVNDIHYADLGLSVNPFLFGNDGNVSSASYYLFHNVSSVCPTNQELLFNAFMATTGIPGKWKDYKALFQQYYLHDKKDNAKLFQIFVDPQVVDTVVYTAVSGGSVLTVDMDGSPYHGFAKTMADLRMAPEKGDEKIQNRLSGKVDIHRDLNDLQGRLYANPKILLESKYVTVETHWRHPMSEAYYNKLNGQAAQDLSSWLPLHCYLDDHTFVEGIPALKKSYQYAYEGQMGLPYREQEPKSLLPSALKDGNAQLVKQILDKSPDIDINEKLPNITYRGYAENVLHPLEFLKIDTPNFSEIIKILVEKGLKKFQILLNNNILDKILNELILCQDKMSKELLNDFNDRLDLLQDTGAGYSCDRLIENFKKGYTNLASYMLNASDELSVILDKNDLLILANILKTNKTLKNLVMDEKTRFSFLTLLAREKEEECRQAPWFQKAWDDMIADAAHCVYDQSSPVGKVSLNRTDTLIPFMNLVIAETGDTHKEKPWFKDAWTHMITNPNDYIKGAYTGKYYSLLSKILRNTTSDINLCSLGPIPTSDADSWAVLQEGLQSNPSINSLKLNSQSFKDTKERLIALLKMPHIHTVEFDASFSYYDPLLNILVGALKDNSTLHKLIMNEQLTMLAVMDQLLLNKEGTFYQAPWFTEKWQTIIDAPEEPMTDAYWKNFHTLLQAILEQTPQEIDLARNYNLIPSVLHTLENNIPFKSESLNFGNHSLSEKNRNSLAAALAKNTVLKKLTLNKDEMLKLMFILDQDEAGAFRTAPWYQNTWDALFASPVESIQAAVNGKLFSYISKIIANTSTDSLDLREIKFGWNYSNADKAKWSQALLEGLKANSTLKELQLNDQEMLGVMVELMDSPQGPYLNAPWFSQARTKLFKDPQNYIRRADWDKNYGAIVNLLKSSPEEIEVSKYLSYKFEWLNLLIDALSKDEPIFQLNLSGGSAINNDHLAQLADALKVNTKLTSLNLSNCRTYGLPENEVQLLSDGLRNNKTLTKLILSKEDMFAVINDLKKNPEGTYLNAPWFDVAWKEIIKNPLEENLKFALKHNNHELVFPFITDTKADSLDTITFSTQQRYSSDKSWIDPVLKGLQLNNTIRNLKIYEVDFSNEENMKKLTTFLQTNKTLKHLKFWDNSKLEDNVKELLIETLKKDISLEELVFSPSFKLEVLNDLYPYKDQLFGGIKKWVEQGILDLMSNPGATLKSCEGNYGQKTKGNLIPVVLEGLTEVKMSAYHAPTDLFAALKTNKTVSVLDLEFGGTSYISPIFELAKFLEDTKTVHTLRLDKEYLFDPEEAKALSAALIKNENFGTLDLTKTSSQTSICTLENLAIFADAMKQTNFSKILKVPAENQLDLLNAVMPHKKLMTRHWLDWMNPLWEQILANPQESLVKAIMKAHQNIALAILELGTVSTLVIEDSLYDQSKVLLMDILKTDKTLQSVKLYDYSHYILVELFPLKDSLSKGVQEWIERTWNGLMENPEKSFQDALYSYRDNEILAKMILNRGALTTLNLEARKFSSLGSILRGNKILENLSFSGQIYDMSGLCSLFDSIGNNKKSSLKGLDLSECVFLDKIAKYHFQDVEDLLKKKKDLTIILSKDAFKENILTDVVNSSVSSSFVASGQLVIK